MWFFKVFKDVGVFILELSLIGCIIVIINLFSVYLYVVVKDKHKGMRLFNALTAGFTSVKTYIFIFIILAVFLYY